MPRLAERAVLYDTADLTKHAKELFGVKPEILQGLYSA